MRCFGSMFILLVVISIIQVLCDDTAEDLDKSRERRQAPRGGGGYRGPPRRSEENPLRNYNEPGNPQRYAQPLSLNPMGGGYGGMNNIATVGPRIGTTSSLMLGMGAGIGTSQGASSYGIPAAQNTGSMRAGGGGGGGGLLGLLNLGGVTQNPSSFGADSTHNANGGALGLGNALGGLLNVGGPPTNALINIGVQMPDTYNNPTSQGSQGSNNNYQPPPRHPDNGNFNQGYQQNGGRPGGQPNGRPSETEFQPHENGNDRYTEDSYDARPHGNNQGGGNRGNGHRGGGGNPNRGNINQGNQEGGYQGNGNQGSGNQGGGSKKCRGNQYTCQNRECVARGARCNGVTDCQDASDEFNCNGSENPHGGQGTSIDSTTTAAPGGLTTVSLSHAGCTLPEQPTGGSFELGSCEQPCNVAAGTRVPLTSFLTYKCDQGYTLKGNNVSFCHNGSWYLPPTCVKTCAPLKSNSVDIVCKLHGEIVSCESAIAPGTKASLACRHSYKIPLTDDPAYRELTCLEEGIWDRTLFRCLPECGTAVAHGNTLIVNGFTAKLGVFPWHVGIYQKNSADKYDQICAGTLVSPDLVISAAHCFYDDTINEVLDASNYAVGAGKHYRLYNYPEKYAQKSLVKTIEVASRYYGASGNFAEDISLVRLVTPFTLTTLVRPICMDWDNTYEREQLQSGQVGKAVGWGKNADGEPSNELQEINLPYIPYQECVNAVPEEFKGYVTADKFCAGYLNGSSLCEGDSGGGLNFPLNGLWYLRGIVSVSPVSQNTCDNNYYTAFTNVGRFLEWIRAAYISTQ